MIDDLRILLSRSTLGENNDDVLQKKANAINEFIKDSDSISQYTDLVKFVYSLESENDSINKFRQFLTDAEPGFQKYAKNLELKMLSIAALKSKIDDSHLEIGASISLALVNCFGFGLREKFRGYDVAEFSEQSLKKAIFRRSILRTDILDESLSPENAAIKKLPSDVNQFPVLIEKMNEILSLFEATMNDYTVSLEEKLREIITREKLLKEENNILWWLFSKNSTTLHQPWSQISLPLSYLVIGEELANSVEVAPGPGSYEEIIKKVVSENYSDSEKEVSMKTLVSKIPRSWIEKLIESTKDHIDMITPIHYMLMRSLEPKFNFEAAASEGKIKSPYRLSPFLLIVQMYRESIFIKSVSGFGK